MNYSHHTIQKRFLDFFKERHLEYEGRNFLVAASGGLDSTVLCQLCKESGLAFSIAHCNFQLRGEESDRDEDFVRALGKKMDIAVFVNKFDTTSFVAENKISIQEAARKLRYGWFEEIRGQGNFSFVLLAHHADDNIETLLMNFFRGTGWQGLTGIPEMNREKYLLRPLISFRRKELLDYALPLKKGFFHDWWLAYVATNVGEIDFIPQCLVRYRQHDTSDTNILKIEREKNAYRFGSMQKIEREYKWLGYCAAFKYNKRPQIVTAFYDAFTERMNKHVSFKLSRLLFKYRDIIFYVRKRSYLNKLNFIYSKIWGGKAKKMYS